MICRRHRSAAWTTCWHTEGWSRERIRFRTCTSTDAEVIPYKLRVLKDDRNVFPHYDAVILYRLDLEKRKPGVIASLRGCEGTINEKDMAQLNAEAQIEHVPESTSGRASSWTPDWRFTWQRRGMRRCGRNCGAIPRSICFWCCVSLAAAVLMAVPLGILAAKLPGVGRFILALVGVIQTLPSLALLSLMVPLLGLGAWPAIVALYPVQSAADRAEHGHGLAGHSQSAARIGAGARLAGVGAAVAHRAAAGVAFHPGRGSRPRR